MSFAARRGTRSDSGQARRLLALAAIYDGSTRTEAAKIGGVTLQIVRDWVMKFNTHGPSGLIAGKAPGQTPRLTSEHRAALARMVEDGPIPAVHGVVRWRLVDLCQQIFEAFHVVVSTQTMSRELRAMDYRKLSARSRHHAQATNAIEDFKKASPARLEEITAREKNVDPGSIEVLVCRRGARRPEEQDHPTLGQARNASLSAERPAHCASTYIFGAICPKEGKAVGLILPKCNTGSDAVASG